MSNTRICRGKLHPESVELPIDNFGVDKRAKDGLQTQCKECINTKIKEARDRKKTPKLVKEVSKLNQLLTELPKHNNNLAEAYHAMGHGDTLEGANVSVNKFLTKVSDEALETVLAQFRNPDKASRIILAFEGYVASVLSTGTHTEQRDMFREAFRIFGWGSDKHEIKAGALAPDLRKQKMEEVNRIIEGKVVDSSAVDEEEGQEQGEQ